jgi:hypothetical protein
VSTMNLSSLNVDVLLYLMKFVDPVDRFNLALSGILKGLKNLSKGIDLRKRYFEHFTQGEGDNQIVIWSESSVSKLNWDYVVVARASWKSGESSNIDK